MRISHLQKKAAQEIIATALHNISRNEQAAALSWSDLEKSISEPAKEFASKICSINTEKYGVHRPPVDTADRDHVMVISNQTYQTRDGIHTIPDRLVPPETIAAFTELNNAMEQDIGHKLVIQSGYRSLSYQLFVFIFQLKSNNWNIEKTLRTVALPGYSEHAGNQQALDLRAKRFLGRHETYDFARTAHFQWLKDRAEEFGFILSYPENNATDTRFEPWHWRHSHTAS